MVEAWPRKLTPIPIASLYTSLHVSREKEGDCRLDDHSSDNPASGYPGTYSGPSNPSHPLSLQLQLKLIYAQFWYIFFWNRTFCCTNWISVHTMPVNLLTETSSSWNRSTEWLKAPSTGIRAGKTCKKYAISIMARFVWARPKTKMQPQ